MLFHSVLCVILGSVLGDLSGIYRNPGRTRDGRVLYEGDLLLNEEQIRLRELLASGNYTEEDAATLQRKMDGKKWSVGTPIKYYVTSEMRKWKRLIRDSLYDMEDATCLQWEEVSSRPSKGSYVYITANDGCYSALGAQDKAQELSLGEGCQLKSTIIHEFMHSLGSEHEQCRPDRDDFISVFRNNAEKEMTFNFDKNPKSKTYNVLYDYTSVMHYESKAFSANGKKTMVTKNPTDDWMMDGPFSQKMSHRDKAIINIHYGCDNDCDIKTKDCQNGGYVDKTCQCICPKGATGANCETLTGENYYPKNPCQEVTIRSEGTIQSPGYPNNYKKKLNCYTWIKPPKGTGAVLNFEEFETSDRYKENKQCIWDYLEIRYGDKFLDNPDTYCGRELRRRKLTFPVDTPILLYFKTQYDWNKGYKASVTFN